MKEKFTISWLLSSLWDRGERMTAALMALDIVLAPLTVVLFILIIGLFNIDTPFLDRAAWGVWTAWFAIGILRHFIEKYEMRKAKKEREAHELNSIILSGDMTTSNSETALGMLKWPQS